MLNSRKFSGLLIATLICSQLAHAEGNQASKTASTKPSPSIEMLELLGELSDDDPTTLDELINDMNKTGKANKQHQTTKKSSEGVQNAGVNQ